MLYYLFLTSLLLLVNSQCGLAKPPIYTPPSTPIYKTPTLNLGSCDVQQPQITSLYLKYEYLDDRVNFTIQGWDKFNDSLPPNQRAKTKFNIVPLIPKYIYFGHPIGKPIITDKTIADYHTGDRYSCDNFNFNFGSSGLNVDRINLFETKNLTNISVFVKKDYVENYLLDDNRMLTYGFMSASSPCTTNDLNKSHCWCPILSLVM